jgi:hypothetical protein
MRRVYAVLFAFAASGASCGGTTGDELVHFSAFASGVKGAPRTFDTYLSSVPNRPSFRVQLTTAEMHIGAVYFDESPPSTGFDTPECITPDVYAAQIPGAVDIDLLSTQPQEFSVFGNGSADVAESWDLWLTDGTQEGQIDDIDSPTNQIPSVKLTGIATRLSDQKKFPFGAIVSINQAVSGAGARLVQPSPALPGQYPICKERILQIGGIDLGFFQGGTLRMTVDPTAWFRTADIDFSSLDPTTGTSNAECDLDTNSDATYAGAGEPCNAKGLCQDGFVCTTNNTCVKSCGASGTCQDGFVCNSDDGLCIVPYCIPDTNFGTGPGGSAGLSLFHAILEGGSTAYSVTYSK